ncbi:BMP family lipoprotein [Tianweitania sediminis]|jgi:basic membrane protein A|uniref:BMP family ABC transporter substrate-binding protein n=1 Tax=Tianweitania sediminis TaxID=1502156 RepID=A0A8J7R586_9HYPH|nr:BMP family ABC transporter substrate-binding protein [Tianweitania sediminis]MBP0441151.1 BMP family ABC transporter substrate-binding protein [Tianweitania sediminis]HEV7416671.1 BMP family ABC transporter substrate-binding protein [Tianweitania sediminis]
MKRLFLGLLTATALSMPAWAQDDVQPALLFDLGGKFDKSFNEAAYNGAEKFKAETNTDYVEFEVSNEAQREQALRRFADDGRNPIVAIGFAWSSTLEKVAKEYPELNFAIIDSVVDAPNVQSVVYKEEEGSYLVGLLAAMAAESDKVGFVGGMDIPLIRKFACGYVGGAKAAGATDVLQNYTGDTPAAWNDPTKGSEIAKSQIDQGADVIYHAAGGTGVGVLQAAADAGKLGIGVDSNQNMLHPGKILTSMVKRVDVAVYNAFTDAAKGEFKAGTNVLGLKEGGVDYAMDENNKDLVTEEMKAAAEKAKADIIAGTVTVHDYMSDNACPY